MRLIVLLLGLLSAASALAEAQVITFANDVGERSISGVAQGFEVVSYGISARAGQSISYQFGESTTGVLANIWPPGATQAASIGSPQRRIASINAATSGVYQVDVLQPVIAARRGASAAFDLIILVATPPSVATSEATAHHDNAPVTQSPLQLDSVANAARLSSTSPRTTSARDSNPDQLDHTRKAPVTRSLDREASPAFRAPDGMERPKIRPVRARVIGISTMLNVRARPSADANIVGAIANDTDLLRGECSTKIEQRWCRVETSRGVLGWVAEQFLTVISEGTAEAMQ